MKTVIRLHEELLENKNINYHKTDETILCMLNVEDEMIIINKIVNNGDFKNDFNKLLLETILLLIFILDESFVDEEMSMMEYYLSGDMFGTTDDPLNFVILNIGDILTIKNSLLNKVLRKLGNRKNYEPIPYRWIDHDTIELALIKGA